MSRFAFVNTHHDEKSQTLDPNKWQVVEIHNISNLPHSLAREAMLVALEEGLIKQKPKMVFVCLVNPCAGGDVLVTSFELEYEDD